MKVGNKSFGNDVSWTDKSYQNDVDLRRAYAQFISYGTVTRLHPKKPLTLQILDESAPSHKSYTTYRGMCSALRASIRKRVTQVCDDHKWCVIYKTTRFTEVQEKLPKKISSPSFLKGKKVKFSNGKFKGAIGTVIETLDNGVVLIDLRSKQLIIKTVASTLVSIE